MSYIDRLMKQTATWWDLHATTPYDKYGDSAYLSTAPQALIPSEGNGVRWENKVEKFITAMGDEDFTRAIVWSANKEFAVGDYLYLGTSTAANPETVTGAARIKKVEKVWDIKGAQYLIRAVL